MLGQVFTPPDVATRMASLALADRPPSPLRILDPCVGPGTFPTALRPSLRAGDQITAIELDPVMVDAAAACAMPADVDYAVHSGDYLRWNEAAFFDAVILNPPYLRQEWIDGKQALRAAFERRYGVRVPGTANAYVYFLVKALEEVRPAGTLTAIVYDSWTYTRYGRWLSSYLERSCSSVEVEHLDNQPFDGRLIDATILHATKSETERGPPQENDVQAVVEDGLLQPIDALYRTRRGLRLKQTTFFLCGLEGVEQFGATQFLKHVRLVDGYAVSEHHPQAALLVRPTDRKHRAVAELERRLTEARERPEDNRSIITWADERPTMWFSHAAPPRAPLVFNYYVRGRQRHLVNCDMAYADNFYGLWPRHDVPVPACLAVLNASLTSVEIARRSRNQGSGLCKIQLYEYREVRTPAVHLLPSDVVDRLAGLGLKLTTDPAPGSVVEEIDAVLADCGLTGSALEPVAGNALA